MVSTGASCYRCRGATWERMLVFRSLSIGKGGGAGMNRLDRVCGVLAASAVLLVLLSACAKPAPRPGPSGDQTAVIWADYRQDFYALGYSTVTITEIDGTRLVGADDKPVAKSFEVAPGKHKISFRYGHSMLCLYVSSGCVMDLSRTGKLTVDVRAGRVYRLFAKYQHGELWAWVIDESDGLVIADDARGGSDWAAGQRGIDVGTGL